MHAKADLRASNARVRVRLEREREAPNRSARLCDPRARTRSACDTNSRLVYPTASELAWPGNWGRRSVAIGEGRGRGTAARARNPPLFSAPCTQRCGHRVWCVCVCQMLLSRRPNVMAGMQTGDALAAPPQCCGNEGLWGIAHGSPPAPLSRTCGAHRVRRRPGAATGPNTAPTFTERGKNGTMVFPKPHGGSR